MSGLDYKDDGSQFEIEEVIHVLGPQYAGTHISVAQRSARILRCPFFLFNDIIYRTLNLEKVMVRNYESRS